MLKPNRIVGLILAAVCTLPVYAESCNDKLLSTVSVTLQAEDWVTSETALVRVDVNAAIADQSVESVQNHVMDKLKQLSASGAWHISSLDRQPDKSGLETLQIQSEARVPQSDLNGLRNKVKSMSKPGETYTINAIQFIPSADAYNLAYANLRNNIYQQAQNEINTLNKIYPTQHYSLYQINFFSREMMPAPKVQSNVYTAQMAAGTAAEILSVGNKIQLSASAVLASAERLTCSIKSANQL